MSTPCPCCDIEMTDSRTALAYGVALGARLSAVAPGGVSSLMCDRHRVTWVTAMMRAVALMREMAEGEGKTL